MKRLPKEAVRIAVGGYLFVWIVSAAVLIFTPVPDPLFPPDYSVLVADRLGAPLRVFLNGQEQWHLPPGASVPRKLETAVTFFEDRHFSRHGGVHFPSVARALRQNALAGRRVSGGSTLTMQLARIADPKPRTVYSKVIELFQAWRIEGRYSKAEILSLYLDHAPYGGNIRGVGAAAFLYFGKTPEALTWGEAATLAVLPNAPSLASPLADEAALRRKRDRLLVSLNAAGYFDAGTLASALAEPTPEDTIALPFRAPHFSRLVAQQEASTPRDKQRVVSSLDPEVQHRIEQLGAFHGRRLRRQGVTNLSALVVDTPTGEVRGYLAAVDFFDVEHDGQVDGIRSPRSSGSILKPFLYALAMDDGLLLPESLVEDVPVSYGGFSPQNIDRRYRGLLPMHEALTSSLNVPAAMTLSEVGLERFYALLEQGGLRSLFRPAGDYGLPLVLGGAEASPWDVARLYRGLATGDFSDLLLVPGEAKSPGHSPLSDGSRYLTVEMLKDVTRPGADALWGRFQDGFPIAWKTGTSYGQRDAWSVGVTPEWTVVVWVGDFAGRPNPDLRSTTAAAPLLFDILNTLKNRQEPTWFVAPRGALSAVEVCDATGFRATPQCENTHFAMAPRNAPPLPSCPYHEQIYVSAETGRRVDSRCWRPDPYEAKTVFVVPPEAAPYLPALAAPPPWEPACQGGGSRPLTITYPQDNARLYLPRSIDGSPQGVTLRVSHRDRRERLFWYLNEMMVGETERHHSMSLNLGAGDHVLTVVDGSGYRDRVSFRVEGQPES